MGKAESILECRRCKAGFDVSEMKPDARFRCENCGAWLRVPRPSRRGPIIAVVSGLAIVATVVIVYLVSTSGAAEPDRKPGRHAEQKKPEKDVTPESPKKAVKDIDFAALEYEEFKKQARSGRLRDILALARFCKEHERYRAEAEKIYRTVLNDDPENEEALKALGLACLENLHVPRKWYDELVKSPWFEKARKVLDKEVKSKQDLRDVGLSYAYAPPFVLVRERSESETEDRLRRRTGAAILLGLPKAFNELIGKDLEIDATKVTAVIPVFWFRTQRAVTAYEESRPPDLLEIDTGNVNRNPNWCFCNEEEITRLTLCPLATEAAEKLVTIAAKNPKAKQPLPRWVVQGLAGHLARVKCAERKLDSPAVTYVAPDPGTLRTLSRSKDRTQVKGIVASSEQRAKLLEQLKKFLKERGITNVDINSYNVGEFANPRDAWALVGFFLRGESENRKRFFDYLARVQKGEVPVKAFHAAFAPEGEKKADFDQLDAAWLKWIKAEAEKAKSEKDEGNKKE